MTRDVRKAVSQILGDDDEVYTFAQAAKVLPGRPHSATFWRWRTSGCRGVRLETVMVGGRRMVRRSALEKFIAAVTTAADGANAPPQSTKQRAGEVDRAKRDLAQDGI